MLEELLSLNIFAFFVVFSRLGTAFSLLPGISAVYIPIRVRLAAGLIISFAVTPLLLADLPVRPSEPALLLVLIVGEVFIGVFFATIARIIVAALHIAGTFISYFASLANALVQDPVAQQQSSILSGFLTVIGITMMFVTDFYHVILRALVDSYSLFPPGEMLVIGDFARTITRHFSDAAIIAFKMSAPFLLVAMIYYIGLGILGRLMPQLQVFFFGLPVQVSIQIWVLALCLSGIMMVFMQTMGTVYRPYLAL